MNKDHQAIALLVEFLMHSIEELRLAELGSALQNDVLLLVLSELQPEHRRRLQLPKLMTIGNSHLADPVVHCVRNLIAIGYFDRLCRN